MAQISVIVPMYRVENYIKGCLKSLQNQTFKDFECICVDDGSPDGSAAIANSIASADARFMVVSQANAGLSEARNAGVSKASAPYVFFLDSDDYLHPQALEILIKTLKSNQVDVVNCALQTTSQLYKNQYAMYDMNKVPVKIIDNPLTYFCKNRKIKTGACLRLYKKTILEQVPFIKGIHFEDVPFTCVCFDKIKKLAFVDLPLYYYYQNPDSIMRSTFSTSKIDSYNHIIRYLNDYFEKNDSQKLPLVRQYVFNQRIKMMLNQCVRKQRDKAQQEELFAYAQKVVTPLLNEGLISFAGLKLKHKITLYLLTRAHSCKCALRFARLFH